MTSSLLAEAEEGLLHSHGHFHHLKFVVLALYHHEEDQFKLPSLKLIQELLPHVMQLP
jgi:hypothetical protein